jgi:hypothetical protein
MGAEVNRSSSSSSFSRWPSPPRHADAFRFGITIFFPQPPCPIASPEAQAAPAPPAPDIPLPDLTEIIWGETGDGRLVAIGKLRVLSSDR